MMGFPGGSDGKESSCSTETWVRSLGQKDPLEKEMATHSSVLAWKNPMNRGAWQATVHGVTKSKTQLSFALFFFPFIFISWRLIELFKI